MSRHHLVRCDVCRTAEVTWWKTSFNVHGVSAPWRRRGDLDICSDECEIVYLTRKLHEAAEATAEVEEMFALPPEPERVLRELVEALQGLEGPSRTEFISFALNPSDEERLNWPEEARALDAFREAEQVVQGREQDAALIAAARSLVPTMADDLLAAKAHKCGVCGVDVQGDQICWECHRSVGTLLDEERAAHAETKELVREFRKRSKLVSTDVAFGDLWDETEQMAKE